MSRQWTAEEIDRVRASGGSGPSAGVWTGPASLGFTRYTGAPDTPAWLQALMGLTRGASLPEAERALRDQPSR
jgi:hypothetical protein